MRHGGLERVRAVVICQLLFLTTGAYWLNKKSVLFITMYLLVCIIIIIIWIYSIVYFGHHYNLSHVETLTHFKRDNAMIIHATLLWHQLERKNGRKIKIDRARAVVSPAL